MLERAVELAETRRENEILRRQLRDRGAFGELVGNSETMQQVYMLIEQVASSSASVLITGESGTGKELVARTIHNLSPRRNAPFLAINCAAIPETLGDAGIAWDKRDALLMAETLHLILADAKVRTLLAARAFRRYNAHFTERKIADTFLDAFSHVQ